jgi:hypothetical protein
VAKLTASDGNGNDRFGYSVAIRGNFILVGAYLAENGAVYEAGAAYMYAFLAKDSNSPPQWSELQKLQPNDLIQSAEFGRSLAMDDNIAVVGTQDSDANAAYVFTPNDPSLLTSSWSQITKLTRPTNNLFGNSVAVAGNWMAVGALLDNTKGTAAGAVFVYSKTSLSSSPWTQTTLLYAADAAINDRFGASVAISKDASTIVVGAYLDDFSGSINNSGAAYLFRATSATTTATVEWALIGKFVPGDRATNDNLGISIAIDNNSVVVGAWRDDDFKGSAYVVDTDSWGTPDSPSPSSVPSRLPSFKPSTKPSMEPSQSAMPSGHPSSLPSFTPSVKPSMEPSQSPSSIPSGSPSVMPSYSPSVTPSGLPSSMPSFRPSPAPFVDTASTPGKATKPWNALWSFLVTGFVVIGMIACLFL